MATGQKNQLFFFILDFFCVTLQMIPDHPHLLMSVNHVLQTHMHHHSLEKTQLSKGAQSCPQRS